MAQPVFSFTNIKSNAVTTCKSTPGILAAISINTKGATGNIAIVYDNTTNAGTTIGTIDTTAGVGTIAYDIVFSTGLTIETKTGTAGDLTVQWA